MDEKGSGLQQAHVHINNKFVLSGANGYYLIHNLEESSYRVNISYLGFATIDTVIFISDDKVIDFTMKETADNLQAVLLDGIARRSSSENIERVNKEYIQEQFSGSLANSLERLPRVNSVEIEFIVSF